MVLDIQGSEDLANWTSLATLTNDSGLVPFQDKMARGLNYRFYRSGSATGPSRVSVSPPRISLLAFAGRYLGE